jgi:hypothetical protein
MHPLDQPALDIKTFITTQIHIVVSFTHSLSNKNTKKVFRYISNIKSVKFIRRYDCFLNLKNSFFRLTRPDVLRCSRRNANAELRNTNIGDQTTRYLVLNFKAQLPFWEIAKPGVFWVKEICFSY